MALASATSSSSSSSSHLLHHLFRYPKPQPITYNSSLFLKPFCVAAKTHKPHHHYKPLHKTPLHSIPFFTSPPPPFLFPCSLSTFSVSSLPTKSLSSIQEQENEPLSDLLDEEEEEDVGIEDENGDELVNHLNSLQETEIGDFDDGIVESKGFEEGEDNPVESSESSLGAKEERMAKTLPSLTMAKALPSLTVKEKKELASYAQSLGKKLKCQLVGKSGVTDTVVFSFDETLEKNELLKIKIHRTCPGELEDVVNHLEKATGSVVVGQIGRTLILYRPSLTKLKAEEKRKQAQRLFVRKTQFRPTSLRKEEQATRPSGRGRRGVSRFRTA